MKRRQIIQIIRLHDRKRGVGSPWQDNMAFLPFPEFGLCSQHHDILAPKAALFSPKQLLSMRADSRQNYTSERSSPPVSYAYFLAKTFWYESAHPLTIKLQLNNY